MKTDVKEYYENCAGIGLGTNDILEKKTEAMKKREG